MIPEKQKILIVDDSEMNRAILTGILDDGYDFLEAENGLQALDVLRAHRDISLVLLDIVMPELDGFGVLSVMSEQHWIDQTPVIMISAESDSMLVERAYQLGATDYISRPFDKSVVRRRVINTLMLYGKQKHLMRMITEQVYRREKSNRLMTGILSHIVEFRNAESGPHVQHIQTVSELLLRQLARKTDRYPLTEDDIALISTASALHDIGKIAVPDSVLRKAGPLTRPEWEEMRRHPVTGYEILRKIDDFKEIAILVRHHHERWDGRGYPDGLSGHDIPPGSRVIAVADSIDAMMSSRSYRPAMTSAACRREIEKNSGIMYDPRVAAAALEHWDELVSRYAGADTPRTPYFDRLQLEHTRQAHDYLLTHQGSRITLPELQEKVQDDSLELKKFTASVTLQTLAHSHDNGKTVASGTVKVPVNETNTADAAEDAQSMDSAESVAPAETAESTAAESAPASVPPVLMRARAALPMATPETAAAPDETDAAETAPPKQTGTSDAS